jgi:hypothetical protein
MRKEHPANAKTKYAHSHNYLPHDCRSSFSKDSVIAAEKPSEF